MRCPFCTSTDTQVKDSRPSEDYTSVRRRRSCTECGGRFTTFERIQIREITVIKAEGRKQMFDRDKLTRSMQIALRKRPVEMEQIEKAVSSIVRQLESSGDHEVESRQIGELVMQALARLDTVAFIRFASVYRDFTKPEDFNEFVVEIEELHQNTNSEAAE